MLWHALQLAHINLPKVLLTSSEVSIIFVSWIISFDDFVIRALNSSLFSQIEGKASVLNPSLEFSGKYLVLNGLLSPNENIGPDDLRISKLIEICEERNVKEVIIALNSTWEGEATTYYLLDKLEKTDIKISKLAQGVPAGGDLNYVDNNTLKQAFSWRRELEKNK